MFLRVKRSSSTLLAQKKVVQIIVLRETRTAIRRFIVRRIFDFQKGRLTSSIVVKVTISVMINLDEWQCLVDYAYGVKYNAVARLFKISQALEFNFFALYCQFPTRVNAYLAAVALGDGDANNNIGDAAILSQIEIYKERIVGLEENRASLKDQIATLKDTIELLKTQLNDKAEIINSLKNK